MSYLHRRVSTYYFRRVIPEDLRPAFGGRKEWTYSLKTKERGEGKRLAALAAVETDKLIAQTRAGALAEAAQYPTAGGTPAPIKMTAEEGRRWEEEHTLHSYEAAEYLYEQDNARENDPVQRLIGDALEAARDTWKQEQRQAWVEARRAKIAKAVPLLPLFDAYAADQQMKPATAREWRAIIVRLVAFLGHDDAAKLTADDLLRWKEQLQTERSTAGKLRDPRTVRGTYLAAIRATLKWAVENRRLAANVAAEITVRVPKKAKLRDRDFTADEAAMILAASLKPATGKLAPEYRLARRWIPWLCAYTGARVNEISQLRAQDVQENEGTWAILITPEAGTVKSNAARLVPLHPHIIEQGFLHAISGKGPGPLFYDPSRQRKDGDDSRHFKKVGERLAQWVRRDVGITDPTLQPNHGWRHTFKTAAMVADIPERVADYIQGHAPKSVSRSYGSVPFAVAAAEIAKLPRFVVPGLTVPEAMGGAE